MLIGPLRISGLQFTLHLVIMPSPSYSCYSAFIVKYRRHTKSNVIRQGIRHIWLNVEKIANYLILQENVRQQRDDVEKMTLSLKKSLLRGILSALLRCFRRRAFTSSYSSTLEEEKVCRLKALIWCVIFLKWSLYLVDKWVFFTSVASEIFHIISLSQSAYNKASLCFYYEITLTPMYNRARLNANYFSDWHFTQCSKYGNTIFYTLASPHLGD